MKRFITTLALLVSICSVGYSQYDDSSFKNDGTSSVGLSTDNGSLVPVVKVADAGIHYNHVDSASCDSVTTTFAGGNSQNGNMFDITAIDTVTINGFNVSITATTTFYVYYKSGSYVGSATTASAWLLAATYTGVVATGTNTKLPQNLYITIPAGQTYGFYLTTDAKTANVNYTNGTALGSVYASNADLQVLEGIGVVYPFGTDYSPRIWNGQVNYCQGASSRPSYDMSVVSQNLNSYLKINTSNSVSGAISNFGSDTINSMRLNYTINGGSPVSDDLTSLSIAPNSNYNFTHNIPWMPTSIGSYTMQIWADSLNGNADKKHSNDTLTATFSVFDSLSFKKVLIEEFTNASCDPCANLKPHLDTADYASQNLQSIIRYHVNFPGQDFMNQETQGQVSTRQSVYGVNAVPNMFMDGTTHLLGYSASETAGFLVNKLQTLSGLQSPIRINITNATYTTTNDSINISADIQAFGSFAAGLTAFAVITDSMHYANNQSQETIAQYVFQEVMQDMMPSASGQSLAAYTSGQTQTIKFGWQQNRPLATNFATYPYDSSQFKVIVFVQDLSTKFVWNSETSWVDFVTDVQAIDAGITNLSVYPNPFNSSAIVHFGIKDAQHVMLNIYNMIGSKVYSEDEGLLSSGSHTVSINKNNLAQGIYFLRIETDKGGFTQKLVIQ